MKKDKSDDKRHRNLRQQAEALLKETRAEDTHSHSPSHSMSDTDIRAIVHELRVHQIELEMQNEELMRSRNKAEEMSEKYTDLFDFAPVGYFTFNDENGSILMVNLQGSAMLGVDRKNLTDRRFVQFITPECRGVFNDFCKKTLKSDRKQTCEIQLLKGDEPSIYVHIEGIGIEREKTSGKEIRASLIDITDRRQADEDHLKIHKLESLGILAGGIAHDFNNLLTSILGNISLAKSELDPKSKSYIRLENAEGASVRATGLTQQLLTFSKGGEPLKTISSVSRLIKDSVNFALSGSKSRCDDSIPDDLWPVSADEGQINQVFNNLIINADQAMPEGGIIQITCENVTLSKDEIIPLNEGKYVKVSIKDDGIGIPESYLSKIFDPYFTTKERGKGLGLTTCFSIIKKHGGYITVESKQGTGTTFNIYLAAMPETIHSDADKADGIISGKGKVLIMDDEEDVRTVAGEMLEAIGYNTESACDGNEAIEKYKKARATDQPFDVVIMDLTIPGSMGGKEAIKRLKEINPSVKTIVSSGYANDPIIANYKKYGFTGILTKPYRIENLSTVLHQVIEQNKA